MIGFAAAEVKNPRVAVAKAVKRVFWRIAIFFCASIFVIGMLVPYTEPKLLQSTGNAASSPFVLAFDRAGIKVVSTSSRATTKLTGAQLPSLINAIVMLSALSSSNSLLYSASRQVYGLALRGYAPKIFVKTTKAGLPLMSLCFCSLGFAVSFLTLNNGSETVLNWMQNLTGL